MTSLRLRGVSRTLGLNPRRRGTRGAAPASIVQDGLVAEWRFDDGAGQVLTDYAGGHHGQLGVDVGTGNDPAWVAGGLSFTGLHGSEFDCVATQTFPFPSPAYHVDIVGRFIGSAAPGVDFTVAFGRQTGTPADDNNTPLTMFRSGTGTQSVVFRVGNGAAHADSSAAGTVFDDAWHHLSIDYAGGHIHVEQDGTEILDATLGITPNAASAPALFGTFWDLTATIPFTGILGYITVYDRDLSTEERAQQAAALAAIFAGRGITLP
jgi:Concanavalin A-like lectin/glucanases superfamily